jgi:hypothetical protein
MKKIFLFALIFSGFTLVNVQAQCKKSSSDKKACCAMNAMTSQVSNNDQMSCCVDATNVAEKIACAQKCEAAGCPCKYGAAHFASLNPSIEEKKSTETGLVSYFKKSTCAFSGEVSLTSVQFDLNEGKFINQSPETKNGKLNHCSKICTPEQMAKCKAMGISCKKSSASLATNDSKIIRP